jgi:hypothetical protein
MSHLSYVHPLIRLISKNNGMIEIMISIAVHTRSCWTNLIFTYIQAASRDSTFCIATGYGLDDQGVGIRVPLGARIFISPYRPYWLWGHPASYAMGTGGSFSEVKRPWGEADHSPSTSAEVKKTWVYTSTPPHVFML